MASYQPEVMNRNSVERKREQLVKNSQITITDIIISNNTRNITVVDIMAIQIIIQIAVTTINIMITTGDAVMRTVKWVDNSKI